MKPQTETELAATRAVAKRIIEKANEALKTDIFAVVSYFCGKPMFAGELIEHNKRRIEWLRKMQEQPNHARPD